MSKSYVSAERTCRFTPKDRQRRRDAISRLAAKAQGLYRGPDPKPRPESRTEVVFDYGRLPERLLARMRAQQLTLNTEERRHLIERLRFEERLFETTLGLAEGLSGSALIARCADFSESRQRVAMLKALTAS